MHRITLPTQWSTQQALHDTAAQQQLAQEATTAVALWHFDTGAPWHQPPWCWFSSATGRVHVVVASRTEVPSCCT
jgi:hypothetical protein